MPLSNTQHRELMRMYELTRQKNVLKLSEKKKELYKKVPRLEEIHTSLVENASALVKAKLLKDSILTEELTKKRELLKTEQEALLSSLNLTSADLEVSYDCKDCKDTGYIGSQKCHCLNQKIVTLFYNKSNLSDILKEKNFETLSMKYYSKDEVNGKPSVYSEMSRKISLLKEYTKNFDLRPDSILLFGPSGVGKTFLTSCIAKELLDTKHSVLYYSASALMDTLAKETFSYEETEEEDALTQYLTCDLLMIDDLGTERTNRFSEEMLFTLINERLNTKKATVINTNLDPEELRQRYSDRISSRLVGEYRLFSIDGDDIRIKRKYEQLK